MATRKNSSWRDDFLAGIEKDNWAEAIAVLDSQKTAHAGTQGCVQGVLESGEADSGGGHSNGGGLEG